MSVSMENNKGVTTITLVEDKNSVLPPLCQILRSLCFSPMCFSVKSGMMQSGVVSGLGTVQIMVGLFSISLGPGRTSLHPRDFSHIGAAYWLGGVFLMSGIISVLADRFPWFCSVIFAVLINITGSIFSIAGLALYSIDLSETNNYYLYSMKELYRHMVVAIDILMLILTVLQLCVSVSLAVLGIKALIYWGKEKADKSSKDQLKQVLLTSPGA